MEIGEWGECEEWGEWGECEECEEWGSVRSNRNFYPCISHTPHTSHTSHTPHTPHTLSNNCLPYDGELLLVRRVWKLDRQ